MPLLDILPFKKPEEEAITLPEKYKVGPQTVRDLLIPPALEIESNFLRIGDLYVKTLFMVAYPKYLSSGWFSPVINIPQTVDISMFVHPIDTGMILKKLRKKTAQIEAQISEKMEKGLVRDPELDAAYRNIENLRDALQQATEKLFNVGLYITIYGGTMEELVETENKIVNFLEGRVIHAKPALFQQAEGLESSFPLGLDKLSVHSILNSSPVSSMFPFVSVDLTSDKGILYGVNKYNNSLIIFDRFSLENGNMVIFAKAGSGKSYFTKLEIMRSLMLGTEVLVLDPENEYKFLSDTIGGSFINISLTSKNNINPFDLPPLLPDESPAESLKSNILNITSLLRVMFGTLSSEQIGILDRAITETYASRDITPEIDFSSRTPPTMSDLQTVLESMEGGIPLSEQLYKFTKGSFAGFLNQPTNVDVDNRLVVFGIRDLEEELRPIAMFMVLNFIWNLIRSSPKKRILIIDEAWWMMKFPAGAEFLFGLVKRCRKYFLGVTTITQDVDDFINSPHGKPIITNSSLQMLLKQSTASIEGVAEVFNLTEAEKQILVSSDIGEGIFFAGLKHVNIQVIASYVEDQIVTTDPAQLLELSRAKEEFEEEGFNEEEFGREFEGGY